MLWGKLPLSCALLPFESLCNDPHLVGRYGPRKSWGLLAKPLPNTPPPQRLRGHSEVRTRENPRGQQISRSEGRKRWRKEEKDMSQD